MVEAQSAREGGLGNVLWNKLMLYSWRGRRGCWGLGKKGRSGAGPGSPRAEVRLPRDRRGPPRVQQAGQVLDIGTESLTARRDDAPRCTRRRFRARTFREVAINPRTGSAASAILPGRGRCPGSRSVPPAEHCSLLQGVVVEYCGPAWRRRRLPFRPLPGRSALYVSLRRR